MIVWRCTGRTSANQVACDFETAEEEAAFAHFETMDHDVEPQEQ